MSETTIPVSDKPDDIVVVPADDPDNEPVATEPEEPVQEDDFL